MKKELLILFLLTIFIVACQRQVKDYNTETETNLTDKETGEEIGQIKTNISAKVEIITDCQGSDCFETKFKECKLAKYAAKVTDQLIYYYEILGPQDNLCIIKSKFLKNPNPDWENKEMICLYDNTKVFETASQEIHASINSANEIGSCQGEFYILLKGG